MKSFRVKLFLKHTSIKNIRFDEENNKGNNKSAMDAISEFNLCKDDSPKLK